MTINEAIEIVDAALPHSCLSQVQELILCQAWEGKTYQEIANISGYDAHYIGDVGFKLWQLLSEVLGERVTKNNFRSVLRQHWQSATQGGAKTVLLNTTLIDPSDQKNQAENLQASSSLEDTEKLATKLHQDWGDAIDVSIFYGRCTELNTLEQWTVQDRCRLVAILGMGGIGKTALAAKLVEQIQAHFDYLIWRSLRNSPPIEAILLELIQFLGSQEVVIAKTLDGKVLQLMECLRRQRCLLVLDNAEPILQSGISAGYYREGYTGYGQLLRCIGETPHQSCLVVTSREKPKELAAKEGKNLPIRSLQLTGLKAAEGRKIFEAKDGFSASGSEWNELIKHYAGNPLALKMIAPMIQDFFESNAAQFLNTLRQGTFIFDDIRNLLDRQFDRLSDLEEQIMYWLAINREPVSPAELEADIVPLISRPKLLDALESLLRRSLIENCLTGFTQQPVVMEYMTERLIQQVYEEITTEKTWFLRHYALVKGQAKDCARERQIRVVLEPIATQLRTTLKLNDIEPKLNRILLKLREEFSNQPGYGSENIINLLRQLKIDLAGYDFSKVAIEKNGCPQPFDFYTTTCFQHE